MIASRLTNSEKKLTSKEGLILQQKGSAHSVFYVLMSDDKILHLTSGKGKNVTVHYSCWSRAGADPHGRAKQNQDAYVVREYLGGKNICFFGVFDGHGQDGAKVSNQLVANLPFYLTKSKSFEDEDFKFVLETQMVSFNKHLVSLPHIRSELSGSTAITALLESNGLLTVANVGDSRCIMGKIQNGVLKVECLSVDHTPYVPSEASRIISKQGRIKPYTFDGMAVGPKRVWLPYTDSPGLSMTRAFGDQLGASVGVSSEPEIQQVELGEDAKFLVLCTDGVFEFMSNEDIISYVQQKASIGWLPSDIAKGVVAEANRCWREEEDGIIDDCTAVVALLNVAKVDSTSKSSFAPRPHISTAMKEVAKKTSQALSHHNFKHTQRSLSKLTVEEKP